MEVDNDDSPVKKAPRKKTRYIESDEDEDKDDIASTPASVATLNTSVKVWVSISLVVVSLLINQFFICDFCSHKV